MDDGAYLAVKLLIAAAQLKAQGKGVDGLIADLEPSYESREIRMNISGEGFGDYGKEVLKAFEERAKAKGIQIAPNSYEGIRLSFPEGWALLRMSLHDPLMPLNLEGNKAGDCEHILGIIQELLKGFDRLDTSKL